MILSPPSSNVQNLKHVRWNVNSESDYVVIWTSARDVSSVIFRMADERVDVSNSGRFAAERALDAFSLQL